LALFMKSPQPDPDIHMSARRKGKDFGIKPLQRFALIAVELVVRGFWHTKT